MADNQKTIGDRTYSFGTIPALEAVGVEIAVARVIGEPLFKAFMDSKASGSTEDQAQQAGASAIGLMLAKMDPDEVIAKKTHLGATAGLDFDAYDEALGTERSVLEETRSDIMSAFKQLMKPISKE